MVEATPLADWAGLCWYLDQHVLDAPDAADLRRLGREGWVRLQVTDTAHLETSGTSDPVKRAELEQTLGDYPTAMGTFSVGHSMVGLFVIGSDADAARFDEVYATVWPNNNRDEDGDCRTGMGRSRFRDALHIETAIRYGGTGFVTEDVRLQRRAAAVAEKFRGFRIVSIRDATSATLDRVAYVRRRAGRTGNPDPSGLPDWP